LVAFLAAENKFGAFDIFANVAVISVENQLATEVAFDVLQYILSHRNHLMGQLSSIKVLTGWLVS